MPLFESGAFNHSATFPNLQPLLYQLLMDFAKEKELPIRIAPLYSSLKPTLYRETAEIDSSVESQDRTVIILFASRCTE